MRLRVFRHGAKGCPGGGERFREETVPSHLAAASKSERREALLIRKVVRFSYLGNWA